MFSLESNKMRLATCFTFYCISRTLQDQKRPIYLQKVVKQWDFDTVSRKVVGLIVFSVYRALIHTHILRNTLYKTLIDMDLTKVPVYVSYL